MRVRPSHALAGVLALFAPSLALGGEDETAAQLFSAAKLAFQRKDFTAAAKAFEEADHVLPRAGARYNAAIAWEYANEPARAADLYAGATPELVGDEQREAIRRLAALEHDLGIVSVVGSSSLKFTLGHVEDGVPPRMVHLPPKAFTLSFGKSGDQRRELQITVRKGEITRAVLEAPVETVTTVTAPPSPVQANVLGPANAKSAAVSDSRASGSSATAGWISIGIGGALAAGYLTTGILALDAKSDFEASSFRDVSAHDRASSFRLAANVFAGTALVAGVIGVVLLLQPNKGKTVSRAPIEPLIRF